MSEALQSQKTAWYEFTRQPLAVVFWIYLLIKVFIYDIDIYLIDRFFPGFTWIIQFKFPILAGLVALIWLFTKNGKVLFWLFYILLYPLVVVLWNIPRFLYKTGSWTLVFAFLNTVISFLKSVKYSFIIFATFVVSTSVILFTSNSSAVYSGIGILTLSLLVIFLNRFRVVFKPSTLYQVHSKLTSWLLDYSKKTFGVEKEIKELSPDKIEAVGEIRLQKWAGNLQALILYNRGCYFLSTKLEEYQKSRANIVFYILNFLFLIAVSVFIFTLINFGLHKINPNHFSIESAPSFFMFFYYSASSLFGHSITEIVPITTISRIFSLLEIFSTFLLIGILFTIILSVRNDKEIAEMRTAINEVKKMGDEMEDFIESEYGMSVNDALVRLVAMKTVGLLKAIEYLTKNAKETYLKKRD